MIPTIKVTVAAHAKTNLALRVLNREPSGYHNIETLFALLELHDTITVEQAGTGIAVYVEGMDTGPEMENLAYRAAKMVLDAIGHPFGVAIRISKAIPVQAGLGGGSSDGAAALHAINNLAGGALSKSEVFTFAEGLGSDVPFFASRAAYAVGSGRGDQITEMEGPSKVAALVIKPNIGVSTREAYESLAAARQGRGLPEGLNLSVRNFTEWADVARISVNDFEDVVFAKKPELQSLFSRLEKTAPVLTRMCGSGAALIALYANCAERDAAAGKFGDVAHVISTSLLATPAPEPEFI